MRTKHSLLIATLVGAHPEKRRDDSLGYEEKKWLLGRGDGESRERSL